MARFEAIIRSFNALEERLGKRLNEPARFGDVILVSCWAMAFHSIAKAAAVIGEDWWFRRRREQNAMKVVTSGRTDQITMPVNGYNLMAAYFVMRISDRFDRLRIQNDMKATSGRTDQS